MDNNERRIQELSDTLAVFAVLMAFKPSLKPEIQDKLDRWALRQQDQQKERIRPIPLRFRVAEHWTERRPSEPRYNVMDTSATPMKVYDGPFITEGAAIAQAEYRNLTERP